MNEGLPLYSSLLVREQRNSLNLGYMGCIKDGLIVRFCDPARKSAMAALVVPRAARFAGAENAVTRALEQADQCIAYVQRQLPGLRRVLGAK